MVDDPTQIPFEHDLEHNFEQNEEVSNFFTATRKNKASGGSVPLWLITFTDVMALMLTFFVLLYSMSVPEEDKWTQLSVGFGYNLNTATGKNYNAGFQDAIDIDKIDKSQALDLAYLKVLITKFLKSREIGNVVVFQNGKRLVVSLPSGLLFKSGRADIGLEGKKLLFALGGALSRVKNRIEIVGHTDPDPIKGGKGLYRTNWELSLARSASVAVVLKEVGYTRPMIIRGSASARYDELSEDISKEKRYALSRRVDIVLMNDDGFRPPLHSFE